MSTIKATVKGGRLELQVPADWPDGTEVEIHPVDRGGPVDDEGPLGPDEVNRLLELMERVQPFEMTEEERTAWEADRSARKEWEKANFNEHADKLQRMWE